MNSPAEPLRARLLAHFEPAPERLASYRKEVQAMLDANELALRRQGWYAGSIWVFVVVLGTIFLTVGGFQSDKPNGLWLAIAACFFVSAFSLELVKYFINRSRAETLKELKGLELQVLELKELLRQRSP